MVKKRFIKEASLSKRIEFKKQQINHLQNRPSGNKKELRILLSELRELNRER